MTKEFEKKKFNVHKVYMFMKTYILLWSGSGGGIGPCTDLEGGQGVRTPPG